MLGAHYRLDGVVTLVDAANALTQLAEFPEPEQQIALADRIFLTKCDLSNEAAMADLTAAIALINPRADIRRCSQGELDPADLIGIGLSSARAGNDTLHFLGELKPRVAADEPAAAYLGQRLPARHDPAVKTFSLRFDAPFTWASFSSAMELVISLRGKDLLRVKDIVNVEGNPVVVQGVGHVFHPPLPLDRWPSPDTGSRLVFITRNIEEPALRALFQAVSLMQS
jgi:G3E family GTPase